MKKTVRKIIFIVSLTVFVVCVVGLGYIAWRTSQEEKISLSVAELINENTPVPMPVPSDEPVVLERYAALYEGNKDTIGWLKIDDTTINFVVMQTPDEPDKYLHLDYYGKYSVNGTLYMDAKCDIWESDNLIVYGHHMASGAMLGNMMAFANRSYWEQHKTLHFDTIYELADYEIVGAFYAKVLDQDDEGFRYYQFFEADNEAEFNEYRDYIYKTRIYDTGVSVEYGDKLLTLSTCAYQDRDGRFALVAKKIVPDEESGAKQTQAEPEATVPLVSGQETIPDEQTPLAASPNGESASTDLILLAFGLVVSGCGVLTVTRARLRRRRARR